VDETAGAGIQLRGHISNTARAPHIDSAWPVGLELALSQFEL
jgi:hypothetical protein